MKLHFAIASAVLASAQISFATAPADDLLAGPSIVEEEVSQKDMLSRKLQETGKNINLNSREQNRVWIATIRALELSETQQVTLEVLLKEVQSAQIAYQQEHGIELRALRKEKVAAKKNGGDASVGTSEKSHKRMIELMELAPNVVTYQEQAWVILTDSQQTAFRTSYQTRLDEEQKKREERMLQNDPMGEKQRGFSQTSPSDSDKESGNRGKHKILNDGNIDEASLRRINFLRKLQGLQDD
ncbi:MAG: hypothetical protein ACI9JK_000829 [Phycisphaerales bacterium]|jgi:hypothetical protein